MGWYASRPKGEMSRDERANLGGNDFGSGQEIGVRAGSFPYDEVCCDWMLWHEVDIFGIDEEPRIPVHP